MRFRWTEMMRRVRPARLGVVVCVSAAAGLAPRAAAQFADDWANAPAVGDGVYAYDLAGATNDGTTAGATPGSEDSQDLWIKYLPVGTGGMDVSTCGMTGADTLIEAYSGWPGAGGVLLASSDNGCGVYFAGNSCVDETCPPQSQLAVLVSPGVPVWIRVVDWYGAGAGSVSLDGPAAPPPNSVIVQFRRTPADDTHLPFPAFDTLAGSRRLDSVIIDTHMDWSFAGKLFYEQTPGHNGFTGTMGALAYSSIGIFDGTGFEGHGWSNGASTTTYTVPAGYPRYYYYPDYNFFAAGTSHGVAVLTHPRIVGYYSTDVPGGLSVPQYMFSYVDGVVGYSSDFDEDYFNLPIWVIGTHGETITDWATTYTLTYIYTILNYPPAADAGDDRSVPERALAALDGSGSSDPDGNPLDYIWTQTGGEPVVLDLTDPARPTFAAPEVGRGGGSLEFELVVYDGRMFSEPDRVTIEITNVNLLPTARAGDDQSVPEGTFVALNGSASDDPDGDAIVSYAWSQVAGDPVTLNLSDPQRPTFTTPQVARGGATLTFQLVVSDGLNTSEPGIVNIAVTNVNHAPVAVAGPDQSVNEFSAVALDGSPSYDADGEDIVFSWVQTSGPTVTLDTSDPARPTFGAPGVGFAGATLSFVLTVSDGLGASSDDVTVLVENINHAPIASAGPDAAHDEGHAVVLDGSASSDPDADPLFFYWEQVSGPAAVLSDPESPTPTFTAPQVGTAGATLVFHLTVTDGPDEAMDEVAITVRNVGSPPACASARPSEASLWPPNHKLVPITILGIGGETEGVTLTITSVTQDEPINGLGDGDTGPDAFIRGSTVLLRAERSGKGNGRVYRINFRAESAGGSCTGSVTVGAAPHDQGKGSTPIDDGQNYDSLR